MALTDKLTALADAIRVKTGSTDPMTLDGMTAAITEIETGGGSSEQEVALIARTISEYSNSSITTIGAYAFYNCSRLTSVSFPVATTISDRAFYGCSRLTFANFPVATTIGNSAFAKCIGLTSASFPVATTIGSYAFYTCTTLTSASFPVATTIGSSAFYGCSRLTFANFPVATTIGNSAFANCLGLTSASFPVATTIGSSAFYKCSSLANLYIMGASVCYINTSTILSGAGITSSTGKIYVRASLLGAYQTANGWSHFSTQFVAGDE